MLSGLLQKRKRKGGNLGIFWRHIENKVLYGANLFGDYEKSKYGEFLLLRSFYYAPKSF